MPYQVCDHATNPFLLLLLAAGASTIWFASEVSDDTYGDATGAWWRVLSVLVTGLLACYFLKLRTVGYCLDCCMAAYESKIQTHNPDVIIGYSWGGGIACGLLNRGTWKGATILLAPAGEQMWLHAGRSVPSLKEGSISNSAAVLTVQGDVDSVVTVAETRRLHHGARETQCKLRIAQMEGHFLENTVTPKALELWARDLCEQASNGALQRG